MLTKSIRLTIGGVAALAGAVALAVASPSPAGASVTTLVAGSDMTFHGNTLDIDLVLQDPCTTVEPVFDCGPFDVFGGSVSEATMSSDDASLSVGTEFLLGDSSEPIVVSMPDPFGTTCTIVFEGDRSFAWDSGNDYVLDDTIGVYDVQPDCSATLTDIIDDELGGTGGTGNSSNSVTGTFEITT